LSPLKPKNLGTQTQRVTKTELRPAKNPRKNSDKDLKPTEEVKSQNLMTPRVTTRPTRRVVANKPRYGKKKGIKGWNKKVHERLWKILVLLVSPEAEPRRKGECKNRYPCI
jgi:hypothetical protein